MAYKPNQTVLVDEDKVVEEKVLAISEEVEEVAQKVITQENLKFMNARIGYVIVSPYITKTVLGRCIRTNRELSFFSKFDYIIEVSGDVWAKLEEKQRYVLMYHELLHIDITTKKKGDVKYGLRDHSVKDFHSILRKYGYDWFEDLKNKAANVLELDGIAIDKLKL